MLQTLRRACKAPHSPGAPFLSILLSSHSPTSWSHSWSTRLLSAPENTGHPSSELCSAWSHDLECLDLCSSLNCPNLTFPARLAVFTLLKMTLMLLSIVISILIYCCNLLSTCYWLTYLIIYSYLLLFLPLPLEESLYKSRDFCPFWNWCYHLEWSLARPRFSINVLNW